MQRPEGRRTRQKAPGHAAAVPPGGPGNGAALRTLWTSGAPGGTKEHWAPRFLPTESAPGEAGPAGGGHTSGFHKSVRDSQECPRVGKDGSAPRERQPPPPQRERWAEPRRAGLSSHPQGRRPEART